VLKHCGNKFFHAWTASYSILRKKGMARVTGLEPATSGVTGRRSNQLSYTRVGVGRHVLGIQISVKRVTKPFGE
jgi:hypothetical protein